MKSSTMRRLERLAVDMTLSKADKDPTTANTGKLELELRYKFGLKGMKAVEMARFIDSKLAEARKGYVPEGSGHKFRHDGLYGGTNAPLCADCIQPEQAHGPVYTATELAQAVNAARLNGAAIENEIWTRLAVKHHWGDIMHARRNLDIYLGEPAEELLAQLDPQKPREDV